jgi:hypothetical protein
MEKLTTTMTTLDQSPIDHHHRNGHLPIIKATTTDGIEGIAVRIQERAVQLFQEQTQLRQVRQELVQLQKQYEEEKQLNQTIRLQYLQLMTKQNAVEIQRIQMESSIRDWIQKTNVVKEQEKEVTTNNVQKGMEWNITEGTLVQHKLRQELYLKVVQHVIDRREQAVVRRTTRWNTLSRLVQERQRERKGAIQSRYELQADMKRMIQVEEPENKSIEMIASQVRDALSKVRPT